MKNFRFIAKFIVRDTSSIGAVGNADRIWVSTPQNRTYSGWGK